MKKCCLLLAAGLIALSSHASTTWYNTGSLGNFTVDTLYHATVGPGTTHTKVKLTYKRSGTSTYSTIAYSTIDLTNPYVTVKAGVASRAAYGKPQTVGNIMSEYTSYQNHYFVGINADFAGLESTQSIPCGALFVDGNYITPEKTLSNNVTSNYFIVDKNGVPNIASWITFPQSETQTGTVTYPSGATSAVFHDKGARYENQTLTYNEYYGYGKTYKGSTNTNQWGNEAELIPVETNVTFGNEAQFRVARTATAGNMTIPKGGLVLSAVGTGRTDGKLDALKEGDIVRIKYDFTAENNPQSARDVVGGWGITVKNGVLQTLPSKHPTDISPSTPRARTSIGYNANKTKVVMAVVEETSTSGTHGMTIFELGQVMKCLGCHDALNLDGGGSSAMIVDHLGLRNLVQGSTSYQRPIANGLFAVSKAPYSNVVARIEFEDKALTIQPGVRYQPTIYAYNKYGELISVGLQNYTLSAPAGSFDSSKRLFTTPSSGYFALTANYNGITTSIPVKISSSGVAGNHSSSTPSFSGSEFVSMITEPAGWVDPYLPSLYICGKFQDWTWDNPTIVRPTSDGIYEFTIDSSSKTVDFSAFKMTKLDPRDNGGSAAFANANYAWHIANDGDKQHRTEAQVLANGKTLPIYAGNENNITAPWPGIWHYKVDFNNHTITATTTTPRPTIAEPEHVYLVAGIDDASVGRYEMNMERAGVYSANVNITDNTLGFVIGNTTYGPYTTGLAINGSDEIYATGNTWQIAPGEYKISVNLNTYKMTVSSQEFAVLKDVTPSGYDFNKYPAGTVWNFAPLPNSTGTPWSMPAGVFNQADMNANGQISGLHFAGVAMADQGTGENGVLTDRRKAFTIQEHPNPRVGKCLVYNQQWSPGALSYGWPFTSVSGYNDRNLQLTFYADPTVIDGSDAEHPVRVRIVMQIPWRGRHHNGAVTYNSNEIPNIYVTAAAHSTWAPSHNGVADNDTGSNYPIDHTMFYKWKGEGETVDEIPEEKVLYTSYATEVEPWDNGGEQEEGVPMVNTDRFMVYEFDVYGKPATGTFAVHINLGMHTSFTTFIFKEIKFFNVLNGAELLGHETRNNAPSRAAADSNSITTNTGSGSFLGKRNISYRYYTEAGMADILSEGTTTGIDNVVVDEENDFDAPVEYYNMQGMRVENPTGGFYIMRQGSKATKVLIR